MADSVHADGINAKAPLSCMLSRSDDCAVVFQWLASHGVLMIRSFCSFFQCGSFIMGCTSVKPKSILAISDSVQEEGWRMHRMLICQLVSLVS